MLQAHPGRRSSGRLDFRPCQLDTSEMSQTRDLKEIDVL